MFHGMMQAAAQSPTLPGTTAGQPPAVGGSPAVAPGAGAGNEAAARAQLKAVYPMMVKVMMAFPVGSKEHNYMQDVTKKLSTIVGKTDEDSLVPAAIQQMALAAKGNPLKNAPPVGLSPAAPGGGAEPEPI